jgi:hypothetical protein
MREVISVHVGQAGVQIGNACCECSFSLELSRAHELRPLIAAYRGTLHARTRS